MKTLSLYLSCFLSICILGSSVAQEKRFFIPKEILKAYESGTRSYDGKPGPNYWQNTVDYQIEAEVIPSEKSLSGSATITYTNNSPDALNQIIIRLYQDAFRKANPRANRVRPTDINDGVEISKLVVGGETIATDNPRAVRRNNTNMYVSLPQPLQSGKKLDIEIDWKLQIPETTIRGGAYDSTSFFVSYWYPQMAVYDDVFGWDNLAYDFSTEFYNNLANFDVKITAPDNFVVLSTGVLQNPDEVLEGEQLARYKKAKTSDETVGIIGKEDLENGLAFKSGTWNYKADEVSDFAFCISDHYYWDAANQKVDGRNVLVNSFYPEIMLEGGAKLTAMQQKMMKHFSEDVPGIPYPYPEFTTFVARGGGGMEYPMMANNGGPGLGVTVHEMFHTYFPMYVRVNEKRFAWMDEGWADFTTSFLIRRFFRENEDDPLFSEFGDQVQGTLGTISDLPLITSTQFMDNSNYGYASYPLPAFMYSLIYRELGEETFMKCWREYIRRWAKKSPTPYDFIYTFENVSGQDLGWFWKPWFFNYGSVDVGIKSYKKGKLVVANNGTRPVPLTIRATYQSEGESSTKSIDLPPSIWKDNSYTYKLPDAKNITTVVVNYNVPDNNLLDNHYPPLQSLYEGLEIPESLFGNYGIVQFPGFFVDVKKRDGMLFLEVPGFLRAYLLPKGEDTFESISGNMKVKFVKEGDTYTSMEMETGNGSFTAVK